MIDRFNLITEMSLKCLFKIFFYIYLIKTEYLYIYIFFILKIKKLLLFKYVIFLVFICYDIVV